MRVAQARPPGLRKQDTLLIREGSQAAKRARGSIGKGEVSRLFVPGLFLFFNMVPKGSGGGGGVSMGLRKKSSERSDGQSEEAETVSCGVRDTLQVLGRRLAVTLKDSQNSWLVAAGNVRS